MKARKLARRELERRKLSLLNETEEETVAHYNTPAEAQETRWDEDMVAEKTLSRAVIAKKWEERIQTRSARPACEDELYHYQFLGEGYVYGMMDGEAIKYQNTHGIQARSFELR